LVAVGLTTDVASGRRPSSRGSFCLCYSLVDVDRLTDAIADVQRVFRRR
jgi:hypothetical protein